MLNLTLLSKEQIFGLEIFEKYGTKCAITDFAILLGGCVSDHYIDGGNSLKDRTGWWWMKTYYKTQYDYDVYAVSGNGDVSWSTAYSRAGGVRPALPYSSISMNEVRKKTGINEAKYGEYPQWVVDEGYSCELEKAYDNDKILPTGKSYITDSLKYDDCNSSFIPREHIEYEYNGEKFIRFVSDANCYGKVLSDGRTIKTREAYWVRVEPMIWLVDERENIAISKYILVSGLQFNLTNYYGFFENTDINRVYK